MPLAAASLSLALFAVMFLPEFRQGRIFAFRDAGQYHLPMSRVVSAELRAGRVPFWNPMIACGTPLAANPNNYVYYPSRALDLVLSPADALSVHLFGHWVLGGVAVAVLATSLGASSVASLASAVLFLLCGPTLSLLNFANLVPYLFWTPATAIATLSWMRRPRPRAVAMLAACIAVQTTIAEPSFFLIEVLFLAAVVLADRREAGPLQWRGLAASVALAALVSAVVWVPTLDLLARSARAADSGATLATSLSPTGWLQLAVPQLTGDYHTLEKREFWGEIFHGGRGPFFLSVSFGITSLLLATAGVLTQPRRVAPLLAATAVSLLLASVLYLPGGADLAHAGVLRWLRWPVKFTWLLALALPLVVAFGIDGWCRAATRRRVAIVVVCGVSATLLLAMLAQSFADPSSLGSLARTWLGPFGEAKDLTAIVPQVHGRLVRAAIYAATATVALVIAGRVRGARLRELTGAVFVVLLLGELTMPQRNVNRGTPRDALERDTPILLESRALARDGWRVYFPTDHWSTPLARRPGMPDEWWPRVVLDREQGHFYHPVGERIPMVLVNPDRLVTAGAAERGRVAPLLSHAQRQQMLALLGVGGTVRVGHAALVEGARPHTTVGGWPAALVREPDAPRIVRWVRTIASPTDDAPWSGPFLAAWTSKTAPEPEGAIRAERATLDRWIVHTDADEPGWVALVESRDPGWSALVDGAGVRIEPYLSDFMAVEVPAGSHRVEWHYRPRWFAAAVVASVLGAVAIAGCAWRR